MANQKAKGLRCKEDGCDSPAATRGMCRQHYHRAYRQREFELRPRFEKAVTCAVIGCERSQSASGLCRMHYARQLKYGNPLEVPRRGPKVIAERVPPQETSPARLARVLGVSRQRAHQLLNKEAHNARIAVNRAVQSGQIVKPKACERCGDTSRRLEAHHWDYREVLDVRWVCPPCHSIIHPHHPTVHGKSNQAETRSLG